MKNIIVLCGGKSAEHDISLVTANLVLNSIDREKYNVYPIVVDNENKWFYIKDLKNNINKNLPKTEIFLKIGENVLYKKMGLFFKKITNVDCAILCHHGLNGEDGTIQGLLELCGIPYTSSGVLSSSITMDKVVMKLLFEKFDFNVIDYDYFNNDDYELNNHGVIKRIVKKLDFPIIVKPANLGSSIGISVANNEEELRKSIKVALNFDNKILVEKAKTDFKEINCAVLGYKNDIIVSSLEQPLSWKEFLTFDEKYINSDKKCEKRIYPAKIDKKIENQIKKVSEEIFKKFELSGVVRIDYIVKDDEVFVNEINSIPGSLAYYLFEKENLCFAEIIDKLIDIAIKKHEEKQNLTYAYKSNVLEKREIKK